MLRIFCAVAGELDDFDRLAAGAQNRIVGSLNPDLSAAFADPLEFTRPVFAEIEIGPERAVFAAVAQARFNEHRVTLTDDFGKLVPHRVEEILVRRHDGAIHVEFDHRLRFADCVSLRQRVACLRGTPPKRHESPFSA